MSILRSLGLGVFAFGLAAGQQLVTNDSLVRMTKVGLADEVILAVVASQPGQYVTTPEALIALKEGGVSSRVIGSILGRNATSSPVPRTVPELARAPRTEPSKPKARTSIVQDGTPVRLRLMGGLSSANATAGNPVELELVDTVYNSTAAIVSSGAKAGGVVTYVERPGRMGRGGKLGISVRWLEMPNGEHLPLRSSKQPSKDGQFAQENKSTVVAARTAWLAAPLFLVRGNDINVPDGSVTTAYFDRDPR